MSKTTERTSVAKSTSIVVLLESDFVKLLTLCIEISIINMCDRTVCVCIVNMTCIVRVEDGEGR